MPDVHTKAVDRNQQHQAAIDPATGVQYTQLVDGSWVYKDANGQTKFVAQPPQGATPATTDPHGKLVSVNGAPAGMTAPQLDPTAYAPPAQQFLGPGYYESDEYKQRQAQIGGMTQQYGDINNQIAALQGQLNSGTPHDQAIAIDNQIKALQGQRQTLHDQIAQANADTADRASRYSSNVDTKFLAGQATGQNQAAPVADFYGGRAQVDLGNQDAARGQQGQLIGTLQSDMAGNQPSLAALQLNAGAEQAVAAQSAQAASGGPMNAAFAQRNAALNSAATMQNLNMQQAQLRAGEYATARAQLGGVLKDTRAGDIQNTQFDYNNALQQAQLEAQQRGLNAQQTQFFVSQYMAAQQQKLANAQRYTEGQAANVLHAGDTAAGIQNTNTSAAVGHEANANTANANQWGQTKDVISGAASVGSGLLSSGKLTGGSGGGGNPANNGYTSPQAPTEDTTYGGANYNNPTNDFGY